MEVGSTVSTACFFEICADGACGINELIHRIPIDSSSARKDLIHFQYTAGKLEHPLIDVIRFSHLFIRTSNFEPQPFFYIP